jgi:hypothetical protein
MANEQMAVENGGTQAPEKAPEQQQLVVSDKAQQPNGEPGSQIVVSSEVRTGAYA